MKTIIPVPGTIILTLKSTAKDLTVIHILFQRTKREDDPPWMVEIDKKFTGGKNHIINLGQSLSLKGIQLLTEIEIAEETEGKGKGKEQQIAKEEIADEGIELRPENTAVELPRDHGQGHPVEPNSE